MADNADIATEMMERRLEGILAQRRLPDALVTDGECEECGNDIPAARRKAAPWATTCIECQTVLEERRRHVR